MTATTDAPTLSGFPDDHRGRPWPTAAMVRTRIMELRHRRGLMIALLVVNIGLPTLFFTIRLVSHLVSPKVYGPAGGYDLYTTMIAGVLPTFGFIVAATLGATAGSIDLTEGVFRHLVVTGRSRVALYFARIPAGVAIFAPIVAAGVAVVTAFCLFAAPTQLKYNGMSLPSGMSEAQFVTWAGDNASSVVCNLNFNGPIPYSLPCGTFINVNGQPAPKPTHAQLVTLVEKMAAQNYSGYHNDFLTPPAGLVVESLLWVELISLGGFIIGLGLSSLMGQRTVPVVVLILFEIVITPIFSRNALPHLIDVQRGLFGLATDHVKPAALPDALSGGGGGPGGPGIIPESTLSSSLVITGWLVGWTALGAWRMNRRDV